MLVTLRQFAKLTPLLAGVLFVVTAQAQQVSDLPCGLGEIKRDSADAQRLLLNFPGRSHYKYEGPLSAENSTMMVAEGQLYRYVRDGEKLTTINLGAHVPLMQGQSFKLESPYAECVFEWRTPQSDAALDVHLTLKLGPIVTKNAYQLAVPKQ